MDGQGLAAVITAAGAATTGLVNLWLGRRRDRRTVADDPVPRSTMVDVDAGLHAVEVYKSIAADMEVDRARLKLELEEERDRRFAAERNATSLKVRVHNLERRLAQHEAVDSPEDDGVEKHKRSKPRTES